jgi:hypothetical protein
MNKDYLPKSVLGELNDQVKAIQEFFKNTPDIEARFRALENAQSKGMSGFEQ